MKPNEPDGLLALADALREVAGTIRALEAEAREALHVRDDMATHRKKMQEKAMVLMDLPDLAHPYIRGLNPSKANKIMKGLKDFSRRAAQALDLSSIFYLSSLLYPDDYKEGEKNDLERFIDTIESGLAR